MTGNSNSTIIISFARFRTYTSPNLKVIIVGGLNESRGSREFLNPPCFASSWQPNFFLQTAAAQISQNHQPPFWVAGGLVVSCRTERSRPPTSNHNTRTGGGWRGTLRALMHQRGCNGTPFSIRGGRGGRGGGTRTSSCSFFSDQLPQKKRAAERGRAGGGRSPPWVGGKEWLRVSSTSFWDFFVSHKSPCIADNWLNLSQI